MKARLVKLRRVAAVLVGLWLGWRVLRLLAGAPELEGAWAESTRVLARDGRMLGERRSSAGLSGRRAPLDEVSPRLVAATLASEDRGFYRHDGFDRAAALRALITNVRHLRVVSGGSTITAQLVKRLDHEGRAHERTWLTKVVEAARAQNLEARHEKRAILEAYLAHIDYGRGLVGPEAAAQAYFGAPARDVSLAQAALLAVLPRAPSALDPVRHLDRALVRQRALLAAMHARGDIDASELARALAEPIVVRRPKERVLVAPHVVLAAGVGAGDVKTTIDLDLQRDVEAILRNHAGALRGRGAGGIAAIVVDAASGEVLAEAGSADYFDRRHAGAVDVVRRRRQAGSTLKPFLYAKAFEGGLSPMAPLADVPTELGTTGAVYAPDNFDGTFAGPVSAREALTGSLNVPAVRLAASLGAREVVAAARKVGLALPEGAERYGLSIALGSAEVSPWELAEAYTTLARGGEHIPIADRPAAPPAGERALGVGATALVTDALSDAFARVRGLHARGPFELPFPVALKTGTSTGYRDAWTAGYTHERVVVVWVGNPDGTPTDRLTGASGAGPVFFDVMKRAMREVAPRGALFDREATEVAEVCPLSGALPARACPDRVERRFVRGQAPSAACAMHRHDVTSNRTEVFLPPVYARFLAEREPGAPGMDPHGLAWRLDPSSGSASSGGASSGAGSSEPTTNTGGPGEPRVVLVKPRVGAVFRADEAPSSADAFEVVAEPENLPRSVPLEVLVDGEARLSLLPPYRALVPITPGDHLVEVRPRDPAVQGRVARATITVR
ncbi:MAG: penicillin-binding protein 1C [Deltaproteobacteria bacterium]|nr:penicillin-binding protein 1C [Deltaproteobacteria bacterium]